MALTTQPFPGARAGMNVAVAPHELQDDECQYLQDGLIDHPSLTRRRGPLTLVDGEPELDYPGTALLTVLNPLGEARFAVLNGDGSVGQLSLLSDDRTSVEASIDWPFALPTAPESGVNAAYRYVDAKPGLSGGLLIGVSSAFDANSPHQALAFWRGGNKENYTTTVSVTNGSRALAGTGFTANLAEGMFLFAEIDDGHTGVYIGSVESIQSNSAATLRTPSPYTATNKAATFKSIRGLVPRVTKGRVTAATDSPGLHGGDTKFISQGLKSGVWQVFRRSDYLYIGQVLTVESDTELTLTANAAIAVADEGYVALRVDANYELPTTGSGLGWLTTVYANRQWYFNLGTQSDKTIRAMFSDELDFEAVDVTEATGDWFPISSTGDHQEEIRSVVTTLAGILVQKDTETFAISGTDPQTFRVDKLWGDGGFGPMSAIPFDGGAIWAGRSGIHLFDGQQIQNLMATKFADVWKDSLQTFDSTRYRAWASVVHNHLFLHIENLGPTISTVRGNTATTPDHWVVVINMATEAIVLATNLKFRGSITLPPQDSRVVWWLINDDEIGHLAVADRIFDTEGIDEVGDGPDFYFEAKKFDFGDPVRLKRIKQLALTYLVQGGSIQVDTVLGLNNQARTLDSAFVQSVYTWDKLRSTVATWDALKARFSTWNAVVTSIFVPSKIRFVEESQFFSFRLYQSSAEVSRLRIGPFHIGYKWMRPGRV